MSSGSIRTASLGSSTSVINQSLSYPLQSERSSVSESYLSRPRTLQFWASALVVLPVFLQAPWAHLHPLSACLFTFVLLGCGVALAQFGGHRWFQVGSLLIGVSGSWLGGCLFWGWLRSHPVLHIPVEAVALPLAFIGLSTRWRLGAGFYVSCLLGTAFTDLMMVCTGVMNRWPEVVMAPMQEAPQILHQTADQLLSPKPIFLLIIAAVLIMLMARLMHQRGSMNSSFGRTWLVASAALTTTLWVDGLFLLSAFFQPRFSGLI